MRIYKNYKIIRADLLKAANLLAACSLLAFFFSCKSDLDNDLRKKYLHRPKDQIAPVDSSSVSETRRITNLNGEWQARKKDAESWEQVWVPGAYDFEGEVEFKRSFEIDSSLASHSFKLVAFGINNRCKLFLNNDFIGAHEGGYTSFAIELDRHRLSFDQPNELRIEVDNSLLPRNSFPLKHRPMSPRNFGGIFRDIFIAVAPAISIDDLQISKTFSEDFTECQLSVVTSLKGKNPESNQLSLRVELWDSDNQKKLAGADVQFEDKITRETILLDVSGFELWSPDNPKIYELKVNLTQKGNVLDEEILKIGFNKIQVQDNQFLLNGQPFALRGFDWFEDFPGLGPIADLKRIKEDILRIKETGANALRVVGTPPHPYLLAVCDELGMLVFEEMPLTLIPDIRFEETLFSQLALNYCKEMVARDAYHTSLAAWGLGTDLLLESANSESFFHTLTETVKRRSTRPIYLAYRFLDTFKLPASVDFVWRDFYNKDPDELMNLVKGHNSKKALVLSLGYPARLEREQGLLGNSTDISADEKFSVEVQEVQAYKLNRSLGNSELQENNAGFFIHTFADWQEARPNLFLGATSDAVLNKSGVVDFDRKKRIAFDAVKSILKNNRFINISARSHEPANPNIYPIVGLILILFFLFNFQRSRRLRGNLRRIFLYPHGFYMELKEKRKISALHTFLISLTICSVLSIISSSILFNYRNDFVFNEILNLIIGSVDLKLKLIWLVWRPAWLLIVSTSVFYLAFTFLTLVLRITSLFLGQNLPFRQFFTLVFWSSANFIWLLPIVPIYFRIISQTAWAASAILVLIFFGLWACGRLLQGLKVVYSMSFLKVGILAMILFVSILGGISWYYNVRYALFDYVPIYRQIIAVGF